MATIIVREVDTPVSLVSVLSQVSKNEVDCEKQRMIDKCTRRHQILKDVIYNEDHQNYPYYTGLLGLGGIILGILMNYLPAIVPLHDMIENPEYFYEYMIFEFFLLAPFFIIQMLLASSTVMNIDCLKTFKNVAWIIPEFLAYRIFLEGLVNVIWVKLYEFRYPMPFNGLLNTVLMLLGMFFVEWRHLSKAFRKNQQLQKRFRLWMAYVLVTFLIHIEYQVIRGIIINAGPTWQPILVVSLVIAREVNVRIQTLVCHKAADAKDSSVEIFLSFEINTSHALFLCSILGSEITTASTFAVVGLDLFLNLFLNVFRP